MQNYYRDCLNNLKNLVKKSAVEKLMELNKVPSH